MALWQVLLELVTTLIRVDIAIIKAIIFTIISAPQKSVLGEIVLITGAGSGIGQLMCMKFAQKGATIVAWDINNKGNEETAEKVKTLGGKIYTYSCDVSNRAEVYKVADQVTRDVGEVTILINNAGIVSGRKFLDCTEQQLIKTMEVNVMAHFWTIKSFLPSMMAHNHGHIVTIASMAGHVGMAGLADYCASKFANVGFTESLSLELEKDGKDGVHTTTICPSVITTGMFSGAKVRFPALMPNVTPDFAASRIVRAVLTNQKLVCIPRSMNQTLFMKGILPVDALRIFSKFMGGLNFMDEFSGRQKQE